MSQTSFAGLLLLVSAHGPLEPYHARAPIYACVDPRAALTVNGRAGPAAHVAARQGRCFRVRPRERWEQIAHPARNLLLLRKQPPHPGEPPLYFKSSIMVRSRPEQHARRPHHASSSRAASRQQVTTDAHVIALPAPAPQALLPAPQALLPAPLPRAVSVAPASPAAMPARPAPVSPGAAPAVPQRDVAPASVSTAAVAPSGFVHRFSPLLLWVVVIVAAMLLVRLVRRRRRPAGPDGNEASEAASPDWRDFRPGFRPDAQVLPVAPAAVAPAAVMPATAALSGTSRLAHAEADAEADAIASEVSMGEYKNRCVATLRGAGWDARTRFSANMPGPHVIASHRGLVLALQCHPSRKPVDVEVVKDACLMRERQASDFAVLVSNAPFTEPARQLAARTGIVLLHEDQLASLAV